MTTESPHRDLSSPPDQNGGVFSLGIDGLGRQLGIDQSSGRLKKHYRRLYFDAKKRRETNIPSFPEFRAEVAARRQLRPLIETFSSQIDSLLEARGEGKGSLNLSEQLAGWGSMLGLAISSESNLDQFTGYFAGVSKVHTDSAPREITKGKIHYGEAFTDLFLEKLVPQEGVSPEEQTRAITDALRSWRNLVLLPRSVINRALWQIPDPEKTLFNNIPILFEKIHETLSERATAMTAYGETPIGKALVTINDELEMADSFFRDLRDKKWLDSRLRFPRSFKTAKAPLTALVNETFERLPKMSTEESAALYKETAQNIINVFLMGRYGYQKETMMDLATLGTETNTSLLSPWILLQIEKRGLCKISPETYRLVYEMTENSKDVWLEFLRQQEALGLVDEKEAARLASADDPYQIHQSILAKTQPPPTVGKDTLFLCYPGKFWEPHLEHVMNATMATHIARQIFGKDSLVLASPNRRDKQYQKMETAAPVERRETLFRAAVAGVDQLLVDEAGQTEIISSNLDKFLPDQGFSWFLKNYFNLTGDPELGFIGGFEKAGFLFDLEKSGLETRKAILFLRVTDLIDMPKAIARMRRILKRTSGGEIAIAFLPGFDVGISGRRVRKTLKSGIPNPEVLSTFFHPTELRLLAADDKYRKKAKSLLEAAGPITI